MVWRNCSVASFALAGSGYSALLWQLRVMTGMPRSSNFFFQARAFAGSATSSGRGQCGDPLGPAAPTSTASIPRLANLSSMSSRESLLKGGSNTPMGSFFSGVDGFSCDVVCAGDDGENGAADANAAAVVPRNCRRFMKRSKALRSKYILSVGRAASARVVTLRGDKGTFTAGQKVNYACYLLGFASAPHGDFVSHVRNLLGSELIEYLGLDHCGRDCVHANALRGHFFGQCLGKPNHSGFGRRIRGHARVPFLTGNRSDIY